jgi:putative endonuclease
MWNPFRARRFSHRELGIRGERRAAWHYRLRGWRIVGRNVRFRNGELDLVARRGRVIAFIEVKSRQSVAAGAGFEAVDLRKRQQLIDLAGLYLAQHHLADCVVRYDVVSLFWSGRSFTLTAFADAFRPEADARMPWRWKAPRL